MCMQKAAIFKMKTKPETMIRKYKFRCFKVKIRYKLEHTFKGLFNLEKLQENKTKQKIDITLDMMKDSSAFWRQRTQGCDSMETKFFMCFF